MSVTTHLQQPQISQQSVDQMMTNHQEFLKYLGQFKAMLGEGQKGQTNLKYLLCRLDFNEYYHIKSIREEEEKKRALRGRGGNNPSEFMDDYDNEEGEDDEDEDEDEDEDDDEDDQDDDDDDEDDNA